MAELKSFSDVILQEPERIVDFLFRKNPNISNFEQLEDTFLREFDTPLGNNARIDSTDVINLFNSTPFKDMMKQRITKEEFENLYGDGDLIIRQPVTKTKVVTIVVPKVKVKSYTTKKGITPKAYSRGKGRKWTPVQTEFLKVRKQRNLKPKNIIKEYNQRFKEPRTESSISTKVYRL